MISVSPSSQNVSEQGLDIRIARTKRWGAGDFGYVLLWTVLVTLSFSTLTLFVAVEAVVRSLFIGLILGFIVATTTRSAQKHKAIDELRQNLLFRQHPLKIQISNIQEAWSILELEDFGPGYYLLTSEGEGVLLCSQSLEDALDHFGKDEQDENFFSDTASFIVEQQHFEIIESSLEGEKIALAGSMQLQNYELLTSASFIILRPEDLAILNQVRFQ